MGHLRLVNVYDLSASGAAIGKMRVITPEAIRPRFAHNVPLAAQLGIAFATSKMMHVPTPAFGFRAFVGKNQLQNSFLMQNLTNLQNSYILLENLVPR